MTVGPLRPEERPPLWVLLLGAFVVGFVAGEARALFLSWSTLGWLK